MTRTGKADPWSVENMQATLATFEARLQEMARLEVYFEQRATTRQGRAEYRTVQRAFARERSQIAKRQAMLQSFLAAEKNREKRRSP